MNTEADHAGTPLLHFHRMLTAAYQHDQIQMVTLYLIVCYGNIWSGESVPATNGNNGKVPFSVVHRILLQL